MDALKPTMVLVLLLAAAPACIGSTPEDRERDALSGGGGGPTHRPGEPCLLCHDFELAGTVYRRATDARGLSGAKVTVTDAAGHSFVATTNSAGTFLATVDGSVGAPTGTGDGRVELPWSLVYPLRVGVAAGGTERKMRNVIHREASCGECHKPVKGAASAGRIFVEAP
jgi:hypothetical protein